MGQEQNLAGKVALVSGSSTGIGAAICVELASRGALVAVNYPWASELARAQTVLENIRKSSGKAAADCFAVEADLSTIEGPKLLVEEVVKQTGKKIDILVNNAGLAMMVPLKDITLDQWNSQVNLNARGTLLLTQATLPHLAKDSRIINLSSTGARQGYFGSTVYNGTKSMIESFTRCWAIELGREYGCTVNAISPGPTNTQAFNGDPDFTAKIQPLLDATPMGARMGDPEECAFAVAFFCEERARWHTGVCLSINGGFLMT